jgi:hypothetical protein
MFPKIASNYQRFGYDHGFLLGSFHDKSEFYEFLDVKPPERVPDETSRAMESFLPLANNVAKFIKGRREHYLST